MAFNWTPKRRKAADLLAEGRSENSVAKEIGVHRRTIYSWRQYPEFARAADTPPGSHWVYLIQAENGLTKIGLSSDVQRRFGELDTASPVELELIHVIQHRDAADIEKALHTFFQRKRIKGEWFRLNGADVEFIKRQWGEPRAESHT